MPVKVWFHGVLQAQQDRMRSHAILGALPVWRENGRSCDAVLCQKPIDFQGFRPSAARLRNPLQWLGGHTLRQRHDPLVQTPVPQVDSLEFFLHRTLTPI